jgi:hypothetical protein
MTKEVMLSLLNRASNGNELMSVLDTFASEDAEAKCAVAIGKSSTALPTLETIEF